MSEFDIYMTIFNIVSVLMNPRVASISLVVYGVFYFIRFAMSF
jgi:hypothetical protein